MNQKIFARPKQLVWRVIADRRASTSSFSLLTILLGIFVALGSQDVSGQQSELIRPADTSSPRATLKSFIDSCNELHKRIVADRYLDRTSSEHRPLSMRVLDCLDLSELAEYERLEAAGEAAICLKEILDRVEIPGAVTESADGMGVPSKWQIPGTRITIARVEEGPQRHEYLFSPGTVDRAVEYYHDVKSYDYRTTGPETSPGFFDWYVSAPGHPSVAKVVEWLPDWCLNRTYGLAHWKWIGLSLAVLIALSLMALAYRLYNRLANRYRDGSFWRYFLTIVLPIVAMLIPIGLRIFAYDYLTLRGEWLYVVSFIANLTTILSSIVVVFGASNRIAAMIIASPRINPQGLDAQFIRIMFKLLSIVASSIVLFEGGRYLGMDVTTLLASAGVGGLAIALAAQDTLRNLFGTIMLLTDKPFLVGERIVFEKYDGIVEEIGLRSTKIRLLTGHLVTVPNNGLASQDIENVSRRPNIRRTAVLEMPSGTSVVRVRCALEIVRAALKNHEGMEADYPPRVFLRDLNETSIGIFFIYWYHPPNYWDFLAFSERVNLLIMEQLEAEQIPFAAPSLNVDLSGRDVQLD